MYRSLGIVGFLLTGCSNQPGACGESFCIDHAEKNQLKKIYEMEDGSTSFIKVERSFRFMKEMHLRSICVWPGFWPMTARAYGMTW